MRYRITIGNVNRDHSVSQDQTWISLRKAGFIDIKWEMGSHCENGDSLHTWSCVGNNESLTVLKLSTDVRRIVKID